MERNKKLRRRTSSPSKVLSSSDRTESFANYEKQQISIEAAKRYGSLRLNFTTNGEFPNEILKLKNLRVLDLTDAGIDEIPEEISSLTKLKKLILKNNNLKSLPKSLREMERLKILILGNNHLQKINSIEWPPNLVELQLSHNNLNEFPLPVLELKSLKTLWLAGNRISFLPPEIIQLQKLEKLFFNFNRLNDLPGSLYNHPSLKGLYVSKNPLKDIPLYDWEGNKLNEWKTYYREILDGETKNYKAKLIFLGQGETGKSTLFKRLKNPEATKEQLKSTISQTHGIETDQLVGLRTTDEDGNEYNIEISMWDFGGQEIQRNIHSFFLTENALFLLLWTARGVDDKYAYFKRWFQTIETFGGPNSRVILVQNKAFGQEEYRETINQKSLQSDFPQLKDFIDIGGLDGKNIGSSEGGLQYLIKKEILKLPEVGKVIPKSWENIKAKLEQKRNDGKQFMIKNDFLKLCTENDLEEKSAIQILEWLHQIGVIIHYRRNRNISKYVILDPQWLTKQVYAILLDSEKEIRNNNGRLHGRILDRLDQSQENLDLILEFMISFKLCFKLDTEDETYVIPMQLPDTPPKLAEDIRRTKGSLTYEYRYTVMPKGILGQFIARAFNNTPRLVEGEQFWNTGVILKYKGARGLVEFKLTPNSPYEIISVNIIGDDKQELLKRITDILKELNKNLRHQVNEFTYCSNGSLCKEKKPTAIPMETVQKLKESKQGRDLQCPKCFTMLPVENLLSGIQHEVVSLQELKKEYLKDRRKLSDVLDILEKEYSPHIDSAEVVVQKSKLTNIKAKEREGTLSTDEIDRGYNQLVRAILELIEIAETHMKKTGE
jgi:GTPase SAR1 family protein